jgi:hypothetical protein
MITMLEPFDDVEVTVSRLDTLESAASSVRVTLRSTSSGPAPEKEVYTTRYGGLISGIRSMGRFTNAKTPSMISRRKMINIVVGRDTIVFAKLISVNS